MRWTKEEIDFLLTHSVAETAEKTGRSISACGNKKTSLMGTQKSEFEHRCPVCGKLFYQYSQEWVYRVKRRGSFVPVCSWHCMRAKK